MIAFISGKVISISENNYIIIVNNGIGYEVYVKDSKIYYDSSGLIIKEKITLWISTIQREDGITLYGFVGFEQRKLFNRLLSIQGVGPKSAMLILNKYEPPEFYSLVKQIIIDMESDPKRDVQMEIGINGIGPVAAIKIVNAISKVLSSQNI